MLRSRLAALAIIGSSTLYASPLYAQSFAEFNRPEANYISWLKLLLVWLLFLHWITVCGWVNADCQQQKLEFKKWNSAMVFPFLVAFLLMLFIPLFPIGLLILFLSYAAPVTMYVLHRNDAVSEEERVMTPSHMRFWLSAKLNKIGVKLSAEKEEKHSKGPPIDLKAIGDNDREANIKLLSARQTPGFRGARQMLADALLARAEVIRLDYTQDAVAVHYQVDGLWEQQSPQEREPGDALLETLKTLSGLSPKERRARQRSAFEVKFHDDDYRCVLTSEGVKTGERALVRFDDGGRKAETMGELGMRDKMQEELKQLLGNPTLAIFSSPAGGGLTTTMNAVLSSVDRFMRSFVAVEEVHDREKPIENLTVTTYDATKGETPLNVLPGLARKYPDVFVVRNLADAETGEFLCKQVLEDERMAITSIIAADSAEALLRVLMLKVPPAEFAKSVGLVVNQRLIRKLCEACKQPFEPTPQLLNQLGLPPGKVTTLYRPPAEESKCSACEGRGYVGRSAIFELLVVDDALRQTLVKSPKLEVVRKAARNTGMHSFQDEGLLLVAKGQTSLEELRRVLQGK